MGAAAIPLAIGSTIFGAIGAKKQADEQRAQLAEQERVNREYQRQYLEAAKLAKAKAADTLSRGDSEAAASMSENDRAAATARASTSGRGFELGVGTSEDIGKAFDLVSSIDAFTIKQNAKRDAYGEEINAYNNANAAYGAGLTADSAAAARSRVSAKGAIFGTLLGGASNVANIWASQHARRA